MVKEKVIQKTTYICDKCGKEETVETELEPELNDRYSYGTISEDTPKGFHEVEELNTILCDSCLKKLKLWIKEK